MYRKVLRALTSAALAAAVVIAPALGAPAEAAGTTTTLTLVVHGCDGCSIQPVKAGDGSVAALWRGKTKTVRGGAVHWTVAIRHTVGMSFDIVDPHAVEAGSMANIVVAYRGLKVGERVPAGVAARKGRANGCWAGTKKASVTLQVRVERFAGLSAFPPVVHGYIIRPYLRKTAAHIPLAGGVPFSRTFHGRIGNQDAYFCAT